MKTKRNVLIKPFNIQKQELFYETASDELIWEKFCSGDELAFAYIYKKYVQALYNFGFQLTRDEELTKDIIQDNFISLRFSNRKARIKSIKSYLFRCFYNEWTKKVKSLKNTFPITDSFAIVLSLEDKMVDNQVGEEKLRYVRQAISKLTAKQRQGIMLFFYESMSYAEVAEAMNLKNAKSARKLIYRALENLKPSEAVMKVLYSFFL